MFLSVNEKKGYFFGPFFSPFSVRALGCVSIIMNYLNVLERSMTLFSPLKTGLDAPRPLRGEPSRVACGAGGQSGTTENGLQQGARTFSLNSDA